ncbi:MAG TPA: metal-dependent hydrolase [Candidatus Nanoarchaeia archaeon]|nr:metal-dependent hydrolase [Candidatus Nanoarchaeia archaeon]
MLFKTHIAIAFLFGLLSISFLNPHNQILFIVLVMFGGLLPDIDHPKSKIGKYTPIAFLFEHRGFFHSFLVIPVIVVLLYFVFDLPSFAVPIAIGYISHLTSDAVTKEGIMPLHPISRKRINGMIRTGGILEFFIFVSVVILSGYLLLHS